MKKTEVNLLFFFIYYLYSFNSYSQINLNGTVDVFEYSGSQPDLIEGISSVPVTSKPLIRHVYLASPDVIGIIIDEKDCVLSNIKPYVKQKGDTILFTGYLKLSKLLVRNNDSIGFICGRDNNWYRPFNEIAGEDLDLSWFNSVANFVISSTDDSRYVNGKHPVELFRKSMPKEKVSRVRLSSIPLATLRHHIFFKLPNRLIPGKKYKINFNNYNGSFQNEIRFLFDAHKLRSEAIHVNLYGYQTNSPKTALLSCWMGDGGGLNYPNDLKFEVINLKSNQTTFEGFVKLKQSANQPEYVFDEEKFNHNKTFVYELDFSALTEKGNYKLVIDGVGCSFDFIIDDNIWENTSRLLMKGFFHQRAGIELGPPYTDYVRPRNLHPEDGHIIHKCDPEEFFAAPKVHFKGIQASILEDTSVPEAWGGWMDAGDYDRRMYHFYSVRRMMYLYELNPEYYEKINFNIPESFNNIPDILDEALWCLELFRRTQGVYSKGGVSWWVESIEHPRMGETSWLNSLPTAIIPPTPDACIDYAGVAAQMAIDLKKYNSELSEKYRQSALDAIKWAENNSNVPSLSKTRGQMDIKCFTYINLYRLTGDVKWHELLKEEFKLIFPNGIDKHLVYEKIDAVSLYSILNPSEVDKKLQKECRSAIINFANELLEGASENTYNVLRLKSHYLSRLATMQYKIVPIVVAHHLTDDNKYIDGLARTIQYTMGMNPMNRSLISGLGERSFMPYHHDWHTMNSKIPAGIPNFGPVIFREEKNWDLISHQWSDAYRIPIETVYQLYPSKLIDWPMSETCFNQMWVTPVNEFMVETPMGELLMLTSYLASYSQD